MMGFIEIMRKGGWAMKWSLILFLILEILCYRCKYSYI
jgi:hypothetical protein